MVDFVPVEVYAYEGERLADALRKDKDAGSDRTNAEDPRGRELKDGKPSDCAQSRLSRIIQAPGLPCLPSKALSFNCFFTHGERDLFAGRHDGVIAHWQIQHSSGFNPPPTNLLRGHTGAVQVLDFAPELARTGLLFSGSSDRTIRLWDPWSGADSRVHGGRSAGSGSIEGIGDRACVQTLIGHEAGITSLKVLTHQHNGLVSCSLDRSVRTWFQVEGRALLLYPSYVPGQVLTLPGESWPSALCVRTGASCSLFVADSVGCISLYTAGNHSTSGENDENDTEEPWDTSSTLVVPLAVTGRQKASEEAALFKLKRRFPHFHSLGVSDLQLVADDCFVVSLGFDEKAQVIDAISGALSSTIASPSGARFTTCCWDSRGQMLLLGDTNGVVHLWSMLDDKIVARKRVISLTADGNGCMVSSAEPPAIVALEILTQANGAAFVFTGVASGMKQWLINRDVGYTDYLGHTQGIVAIVIKNEDEYEFLEGFNDADDIDSIGEKGDEARPAPIQCAMFFSASLDNTIRCWDAYERKPSFGFEERASEITCMAASKKFRKLFTGHDNGTTKAWGVHTGEFVQAMLPSKCPVTCLASGMVRDQEFLVTGDASGSIWIWEVNYDSLKSVGTLGATATIDTLDGGERTGEVSAVLFSEAPYLNRSGEEFIVAGYASGVVRIWSVGKKTVTSTIQAHRDLVTSLVMHGCFLFSSSDDLRLRMWNLVDPSDPYELGVLRPPASASSSGSDSPIVSLDMAEPLGLVLSAAADGTVLAWDYSAFEDERAFEAYGKIVFRAKADERIQCLRFWPAERAIICGTADGRLLAFSLPEQVIRSHCTDTSKYCTATE